MITLLVPSLEKGMSRYCKYTSYQGKEDYRCHNYLFRFVSVRTCLWWVIAEKCFCAGQTQLYRKETLLGYHCSHWTLTSLPSSAADVFFCAPGGKTRQENYSGDRDIAQNDRPYVILLHNSWTQSDSQKIIIHNCCIPFLLNCMFMHRHQKYFVFRKR